MTGSDGLAAGEGPLTYGRVLRQALGMFRTHWLRVATVALVLFVPLPRSCVSSVGCWARRRGGAAKAPQGPQADNPGR